MTTLDQAIKELNRAKREQRKAKEQNLKETLNRLAKVLRTTGGDPLEIIGRAQAILEAANI